LKDSKYNVVESHKKLVLFQGEMSNYYPEDYIEIEYSLDKYLVYEVHRDKKLIKAQTERKDEANIYAIVLYKRLYDDIVDRVATRTIRNYLDLGGEKKVIDYITSKFDDSLYSIGSEDSTKISLIKLENKLDVKFNGEYLAEAATLSRGYVVLYNYCEKLKYISIFCDEVQRKVNYELNLKKIMELYIL
jgi:hypothetical protein